jgi:hypothetical protein
MFNRWATEPASPGLTMNVSTWVKKMVRRELTPQDGFHWFENFTDFKFQLNRVYSTKFGCWREQTTTNSLDTIFASCGRKI